MKKNRELLHKLLVKDGRLKPAYNNFDSFNNHYFSDDSGVNKVWSVCNTVKYKTGPKKGEIIFKNDISKFYKLYACDLSWAKQTSYCGGGGNTNTATWDNFPCVVELAKSKGVLVDKNNAYTISGFRYYSNGRKIDTKGVKSNFTCNDPEFKKSNGGGGGGNSSSNENSVSNGIYTTKGDPYQYKIVNCVWYTKGKKITDWKSLENNQKATDILDGRFPNARKKCKENKPSQTQPDNQNVVTGGGQQPNQSGSTTSTGSQSGITQTQSLGTPNSIDLGLDEILKLVNPVKTESQPNNAQVLVDGSLKGVLTTQQESIDDNTNVLKEKFYSTLKKIS